MSERNDIEKSFYKRVWVGLSFLFLITMLLLSSYLYFILPQAYGPNPGEAVMALLAIILCIALPLNAVALILSSNRFDQLLPCIGILLLIWGIPLFPAPFSAYYEIDPNFRGTFQQLEGTFALLLAVFCFIRLIKTFLEKEVTEDPPI